MTDSSIISNTHTTLINALTVPGQTSSNPALLSSDLAYLINSWPAYGVSQTSGQIVNIPDLHRQILIGLMGYSLREVNKGFFQTYFFDQAFYSLIEDTLINVTGLLDWKKFGIALLSHAMLLQRSSESACLDNNLLQADITTLNNQLGPLLAQTYALMYSAVNKLTQLVPNNMSDACSNLKSAILNGQFNDEISNSINQGGDAALEAEWFLFNLWILLQVLGEKDVDSAIKSFIASGLTVPSAVGPGKWSTSYTQWFNPLTGVDLVPMVDPQTNKALMDQSGMMGVPIFCYVLTGTPYFALSECANHMYKHTPPT